MPTFTEEAVLRVRDQSTAQINKINAALKQLQATAKSIKSTKIDFANLNRASTDVRRLTSELTRLRSASNIRLNVNASGIAAAGRQINQLRSQASRPLTLRTLLGGAAAAGAAHAIGRQTVEGTRQADVAKTNLDLLQLGKRRRDLAEQQLDLAEKELAAYPGPQQFNRALIEQRYAENLRQVREGEAAKTLRIPLDAAKPWGKTRPATASEMAVESQKRMEQARQRTIEEIHVADQIAKAGGVSPTRAIEQVSGYFKALDQAQWLTDDAGNFDPQKMREAGNFVRRLIGSIGVEATGQFLQTLVKREKGAKYGLGEKGQAVAAFIAEDLGPAVAGTALSSWMQQTHGRSITKEALAQQAKAGMISGVTYGRDKKGRPTKKITGFNVVDSALAMEDPLAYARQRLVPALKTFGLTEAQIFSSNKEDIDKVSTALNKLYSNTNAASFAQTLVVKLQELEKQYADYVSRSGDPAVMREATQNSITASMNALQGQFQSMLGQLVVTAAPAISGVSKVVSQFLADQATDLAAAGRGDVAAQARVALAASTVLPPALAGAALIKTVLAQTGIAGTVGYGAGLMAMVTGDNTAKAMGGAGLSLIEAADALKGAAADLSAASGKSILPDVNPPTPTTPGAPGKKGSWRQRWGRMGKGAAIVGGVVAGTAAVIDAINTSEAKQSPEKLRQARQDLINTEAELSIMGELLAATKSQMSQDALYTKMSELHAKRDALAAQIARREAIMRGEKPPVVEPEPLHQFRKPPKWVREAIDNIVQETIPTAAEQKRRFPKGIPLPTARPQGAPRDAEKQTEIPAVPAFSAFTDALNKLQTTTPAWLESYKTATTPFSAAAAALSTTVATLPTGLTTSANTFSTVFSTGATTIGGAGTIAADALAGRVPGIGASLGNSAADVLAARVASMSINVNPAPSTTSRPDTGGQQGPT